MTDVTEELSAAVNRSFVDWHDFAKKLQLLAIALSIIVPAMLTAGYSYYLGVLSTYGLDASLFERGFGDAIAESWYMVVLFLLYLWQFKLWATGCFGLLLVLAIGLTYWVAMRRERGQSVRFIDEPITKGRPGKAVLGITLWGWGCLLSMLGEVLNLVFWFATGALVLVLVSILPYMKANQSAKETIETFNANGCKANSLTNVRYQCVKIMDVTGGMEKELLSGLLVLSDAKRIAVYANGNTEVWLLRDTYKIKKPVRQQFQR